ncbi:platelet-activating factor receptor-like [Polyodon spathula]|uniref:platelet-activating factor receptor-like n=1 Tax=Polyodon spathula TaxID=7913 RepID=UPI001B7EF1E3|nr:platelet-activating factor receptor-like [Polyodon spathula]
MNDRALAEFGSTAAPQPSWGPCQVSHPAEFLLLPLVYTAVFLLGLPGNLTALLVFCSRGTRVNRAMKIYLVNLSVADVTFNLTLPLWIHYYFHRGHWVSTELGCRLAGSLYYLSTYSAITFMTLISVNRFLTVTASRGRLFLVTQRGAIWTSLCVWTFWLCCCIPLLSVDQTFRTDRGLIKCFEMFSQDRCYSFLACLFFLSSFLTVLGSYLSILRTLAAPGAPGAPVQGPHRRLARSIVLGMLLVFVVCVAPYHVTLVAWVFRKTPVFSCAPPSLVDVVHRASTALLSVNSCIDPLIYCFSLQHFRAQLRGLWRESGPCLRRQTPRQAASSSSRWKGLAGLARRDVSVL